MLRFRLGSFPIAIEPWFWISALMLSGSLGDPIRLVIWVLVVFASVLVHELGHAVVARRLGGKPEIILRAFGGVTLPFLRQRPGAWAEIALSIAGPLFGLSMWVVAWLIERFVRPDAGSPLHLAAGMLGYTSLMWTVLNLLPIVPLDGGHVMLAALNGIRKKDSRRIAAIVSIVFALLIALFAFFARGSLFLALFMLLFAGQNWADARGEGRPEEAPADPEGPSAAEQADVARVTEVARKAMAAGDPASALAAADLLESGEGHFRQAAGLRIRGGVLLAQGALVDAGLFAGRSFSLYPGPDAAVVAARANLRAGDRDAALSWLRRAVEAGASADAIRADAELGPLVAAPGMAS